MDRNKNDERMVRNSLILVLQISLQMIVPIILCTGICYFIGNAVNSKSIMIIGIIVGIIAGFNGVYKQVKVYLKDEESPGQRARRLEEEAKHDNKMD